MSDSRIETKFSDIPYDIIKIIKNHVTIFKDNEGKNDFFLETFPNASFWKNVFGKMSFGEAIFPKSHYSDLEKLRENRDLHSVVTVHFGRFHSVVTVNVSDVSERGVFTELIYNDVSRGHSAIMQTIQVTIRGLSGWMRAANHNT